VKKFEKGTRVRFHGFAWNSASMTAALCKDVCRLVEEDFDWPVPIMWKVKNEISGRTHIVHPFQCRKMKKQDI